MEATTGHDERSFSMLEVATAALECDLTDLLVSCPALSEAIALPPSRPGMLLIFSKGIVFLGPPIVTWSLGMGLSIRCEAPNRLVVGAQGLIPTVLTILRDFAVASRAVELLISRCMFSGVDRKRLAAILFPGLQNQLDLHGARNADTRVKGTCLADEEAIGDEVVFFPVDGALITSRRVILATNAVHWHDVDCVGLASACDDAGCDLPSAPDPSHPPSWFLIVWYRQQTFEIPDDSILVRLTLRTDCVQAEWLLSHWLDMVATTVMLPHNPLFNSAALRRIHHRFCLATARHFAIGSIDELAAVLAPLPMEVVRLVGRRLCGTSSHSLDGMAIFFRDLVDIVGRLVSDTSAKRFLAALNLVDENDDGMIGMDEWVAALRLLQVTNDVIPDAAADSLVMESLFHEMQSGTSRATRQGEVLILEIFPFANGSPSVSGELLQLGAAAEKALSSVIVPPTTFLSNRGIGAFQRDPGLPPQAVRALIAFRNMWSGLESAQGSGQTAPTAAPVDILERFDVSRTEKVLLHESHTLLDAASVYDVCPEEFNAALGIGGLTLNSLLGETPTVASIASLPGGYHTSIFASVTNDPDGEAKRRTPLGRVFASRTTPSTFVSMDQTFLFDIVSDSRIASKTVDACTTKVLQLISMLSALAPFRRDEPNSFAPNILAVVESITKEAGAVVERIWIVITVTAVKKFHRRWNFPFAVSLTASFLPDRWLVTPRGASSVQAEKVGNGHAAMGKVVSTPQMLLDRGWLTFLLSQCERDAAFLLLFRWDMSFVITRVPLDSSRLGDSHRAPQSPASARTAAPVARMDAINPSARKARGGCCGSSVRPAEVSVQPISSSLQRQLPPTSSKDSLAPVPGSSGALLSHAISPITCDGMSCVVLCQWRLQEADLGLAETSDSFRILNGQLKPFLASLRTILKEEVDETSGGTVSSAVSVLVRSNHCLALPAKLPNGGDGMVIVDRTSKRLYLQSASGGVLRAIAMRPRSVTLFRSLAPFHQHRSLVAISTHASDIERGDGEEGHLGRKVLPVELASYPDVEALNGELFRWDASATAVGGMFIARINVQVVHWCMSANASAEADQLRQLLRPASVKAYDVIVISTTENGSRSKMASQDPFLAAVTAATAVSDSDELAGRTTQYSVIADCAVKGHRLLLLADRQVTNRIGSVRTVSIEKSHCGGVVAASMSFDGSSLVFLSVACPPPSQVAQLPLTARAGIVEGLVAAASAQLRSSQYGVDVLNIHHQQFIFGDINFGWLPVIVTNGKGNQRDVASRPHHRGTFARAVDVLSANLSSRRQEDALLYLLSRGGVSDVVFRTAHSICSDKLFRARRTRGHASVRHPGLCGYRHCRRCWRIPYLQRF